jgi:diguanylate cyclase (GGDEF)-like protein
VWVPSSTAVISVAFAAAAIGWLQAMRRLHESRRERRDLANSSRVIEEERRVLELVAKGASLQEVLDTLTRAIERISPESICTVLLLDQESGKRLLRGSGPSLPPEYMQAVNGLEIGPEVGACGSAAFRNETVVVDDIATDRRFAPVRDFVLSFGLASCWSVPIRDSKGKVLGTFAMYHRKPARPRVEELRLVAAAAQLGGNAIERLRAEQTLCRSSERLKLAEKVAQFGIWEADFTRSTITISAGLAALMGRTEGALTSAAATLTIGEFDAAVHPDDRHLLRASLDLARLEGGSFQNEFRFVLPDGAVHWQRNRGQLEFVNGEPGRATGALTDITDEKNMLVQLQEARTAAEAAARASHAAERLELDRKSILELVAKDQPLDQIALALACAAARHIHASLCSIQLQLEHAPRVAVSPEFPDQIAEALARLPIDSIRTDGSSEAEPIANLSTDPVWRNCIRMAEAFPPDSYRAIPITRNGRSTGVIISFFKADADHAEKGLLESWSQFARLAVERRGLYEQMSFRAQHDHLTTLLNRGSLYEHLEREIRKCAREDSALSVVYFDLDHFKEINDRLGHAAGDAVLKHVSRRILESVRRTDIAARIGGDEFVLILPGVGDRAEASRVGELIVNAVGQSGPFEDRGFRVGASFGISVFPENGKQIDVLLKSADEDMYRAKIRRRARHEYRVDELVTA